MATRKFIPFRALTALNFLLSSAVILLSGSVTLRIPVRRVSTLVAAILFLLIVCLTLRCRRHTRNTRYLIFFLFAMILVSSAIWPTIAKQAFVSGHNDAWAYAAFAQYLNSYPRGAQGDLPTIDQYAATLSNSRFGTPGLLAFFSDLTGRSTIEVLCAWTWLMLFTIFSGIASLCYIFRLPLIPALGAAVFFILCGWLHVAIYFANLDSILFLAIFPFTLIRCYLFVRGNKSFGASLGLATSAAACFYCYPEGAAISAVVFLPWVSGQFWGRARLRQNWKSYGLLCTLFVLLSGPYIPTFITYLQSQFLSTIQHPYPGEGYFTGIFGSHALTGVFALGNTAPNVNIALHIWGTIIAIFLLFFFVTGAITWQRTDPGANISLFVAGCFAFWQGFIHQYNYGLYKVLIIASVFWIPCIFLGVSRSSSFFPHLGRSKIVIGLTLLTCLICIAYRKANESQYPPPAYPLTVYSQLRDLPQIEKKPIALICSDDFDQQWAIFFLREANVVLQRYTIYLTAIPATLRAPVPHSNPEYIVSDYDAKGMVWRNSRFRLFRTDLPPEIVAVYAPNALEGKERNFLWLGNDPSFFYCTSDKEQTGLFFATAIAGPSRPEENLRTVTVRSEEDTRRLSVSPSFTFSIRLHKGLNKIEVWCNEQRTVIKASNGDPRNMLVGLRDFRISTCP